MTKIRDLSPGDLFRIGDIVWMLCRKDGEGPGCTWPTPELRWCVNIDNGHLCHLGASSEVDSAVLRNG